MRLLFASPFPHLPHSTSGREASIDALARRLGAYGEEAAVFAPLPRELAPATGLACDRELGYPVYRASAPVEGFAAALAEWRPQAVVMPMHLKSAPLARITLAVGIKTAFHATSLETRETGATPVAQPGLGLIANSDFTARRLQTLYGIRPPVLLPLIEPARYRVESAGGLPKGDAVLLVNPTAQKGIEIFFGLAAARPDIPFLAVESWTVNDAWRTVLINRARGLGNVELWPSVEDMREAYVRARLLLAPSVLEETYGRVVAEAQVSGIPALVSDRGALPETMGAGGIAVPLDSALSAWSAALDRLWADPAPYAAGALAEAARPERAPERVIARLLEIVATL